MSVPKNYGCLIEEIEKDMSEDGKRAAEKYFKHKWDNSVQMQWYARGFDEARAPLEKEIAIRDRAIERRNLALDEANKRNRELVAALTGTGEKETLAGKTGNNKQKGE